MNLKNLGGRPLKFETPDDLQKAIQQYFDETPFEEYTVTGLALTIGTSRRGLDNYDKRPDYQSIVRQAKLVVQHSYEIDCKRDGRAGSIFALKNFHWRDDRSFQHSGPNGGPIKTENKTITSEMSDQEAADIYAQMVKGE